MSFVGNGLEKSNPVIGQDPERIINNSTCAECGEKLRIKKFLDFAEAMTAQLRALRS